MFYTFFVSSIYGVICGGEWDLDAWMVSFCIKREDFGQSINTRVGVSSKGCGLNP